MHRVEKNKKEQIKRPRAKKALRVGKRNTFWVTKDKQSTHKKGGRIISFHAMHRSLEKMQPFCDSILFQRLSFMPVALLSLMTLILSTQVSSVHMQRRNNTEEQNSSCDSEKPTFLSSH